MTQSGRANFVTTAPEGPSQARGPGAAPRWVRRPRVSENPPILRFAVFLASGFVSLAGDWLTSVAVGVLLYEITGSAAAPAAFIVARGAPRLAGPLVGGWLADHVRPTRALACIFLIQAAITLGLYEAASHRAPALIYLAVVASQLFGSAVRPIQQAVLPGLVSPEKLSRASSVYGTCLGVTILTAPAIGVVLLRAGGPTLLIGLDVVSFLVGAALVIAVGDHGGRVRAAGVSAAMAGIRPVLADRILRALLAAFACPALVIGTVQASIVVIAAERFGSADLSGLFYAAVGAGSLVGGVALVVRQPRRLSRDLVFASGAVTIAALSAIVAAHAVWLVALLLSLSSFASIAIDAWSPAEIARRLDERLLGRANAVMVLAVYVATLVGAGQATVLVPLVGWPADLLGMGAVALTLEFVVTMRLPAPVPNGDVVGRETGVLPRVSGDEVAVPVAGARE